ncbi:MAG: type IV secretion system DNA-binding domain-containing protein [Pseudomonadota bacterium]|nr:type IV secretion system DNA-binding domain-containing protein [Pseudomonadota bacterium]
MKKSKIYIHWPLMGQIPANLPPSTRIVRVEAGITFTILFGLIALGAGLWLVWRPFPILPLPPGTLAQHLKAWITLAAGSQSPAADQYRAWVQSVGWVMAWGRPLAGVVAGLVGCALGAWIGFQPRAMDLHLDGAEVKGADAKTLARLQQALDSQDPEGRRWLPLVAGLALPKRVAFQHFLIAGGTGAGKTTFLWPIYNSLRRRPDTRTFCYDPKGDFTKGTSRSTLLISPTDERSAIWDIAKDLNTQDRARAFAEAVINSGKGKGDNAYFSETSIMILTGILVALQETHGEEWGWGDLYDLAILPVGELREVLRNAYPEALAALPQEATGESKQAGLNVSSFMASFQVLMPLCKAWKHPANTAVVFSIRQWLKADYQGKRNIVLQPCEGERGGYYIGAMLALCARVIVNPSFTKLEGGVVFLLDELPSLGKVEALTRGGLIDKGRSVNCGMFLGFQSVNQLRDIYGREQAEAMLSMVPNVFLGRTSGGEEAAYWVKAIGRQRVQKTTLSHNSRGTDINAAWGTEERDAIMAKDLAELGAHETDEKPGWGVDALVQVSGQWLHMTIPGYEPRKKRRPHVAADWTLAASERAPQERAA